MTHHTLDEFLPIYAADDNAWWLLSPGEMGDFFDAALERIEEANAALTETRIILRALAEAKRLEDIAIASQDAPDARSKWTSWQAQRVIASAMLRAWQQRNPLPAA